MLFIPLIRTGRWLLNFCLLIGLSACSLTGLVGDSKVPTGTADPAAVASPEGAMGLYFVAQQRLADAVKEYVIQSGLLGDELRPRRLVATAGNGSYGITIDSRYVFGEGETDVLRIYQDVGDNLFRALQRARGAAQESRGALRAYAPLAPQDLIGHLYAIEGFAEILLADLYCSGVPLSTIDFQGDFTAKPGSSTSDVCWHAITLLDSAIALAQDSVRIQQFAQIAKARALVAFGEYSAVGSVAIDIPVGYKYQALYSGLLPNSFKPTAFQDFVVSDGEGEDSIGIKYMSLNDPRVSVEPRYQPSSTLPYLGGVALKYDSIGATPIVLASGIEAQLLLAEVQFNTGGPWLQTLNALRTTCTSVATCPIPAPAGAGGIAGLSPQPDPGTRQEQINLLFRERALWLFLTGQRQGDMRRLIRNYEVPEDSLYAGGSYYLNNGAGAYGPFVNLPIPRSEMLSNPLSRGCLDRSA